jgi:hypothetical protein
MTAEDLATEDRLAFRFRQVTLGLFAGVKANSIILVWLIGPQEATSNSMAARP